uniref:Uncharacterized protein n=1 Tax=uncultured Methanosarcinales archaeon TaxID=183757 RepID=A0A7H1KNW9_9EURY|nr:hypothetical protein BFFPPMPJ_00038 [uncultured Methanosarcinales archaeon]
MSDDNTNTTIKDSVCFHFFELPSDLERIRIVYHSHTVEDAGRIASCEGNGSYSIMPVELKPDEGITTRTAVQVPSNEEVSNLYFVYKIQGDDLKYGEFGRIKMSR